MVYYFSSLGDAGLFVVFFFVFLFFDIFSRFDFNIVFRLLLIKKVKVLYDYDVVEKNELLLFVDEVSVSKLVFVDL